MSRTTNGTADCFAQPSTNEDDNSEALLSGSDRFAVGNAPYGLTDTLFFGWIA